MATARPFAYNTGAGITGTDQVGSLAVGTPTEGFSATGLEWWNGPDEDLGYVIAQSVPGDTQPTPVPGVSASVGFFRSSALTSSSFISIANLIAGPSGPFTTGTDASIWLTDNGYWNSYPSPVLYLDAGNLASYSGTGTAWTDLVGGKVFTLNNSPAWVGNLGSIAFAGTDQYISTTVSSAPDTDSATYEMWFYQTNNSSPTTQGLLQTRTSTSGGDGIDVSIVSGQIVISTSGAFLLAAGSVSTNTWYHLAVVRNGTTAWTVYLNGASIGTFNFTNTTGTELSLGRKSATGFNEFFKGYITNFRYVKGVAVYTSNFTPSTNSLTSIQGSNTNGSPSAEITGTQTQLLLNAFTNNFLKDSSSYNLTMSNPNGATSVTNSPFTGGGYFNFNASSSQYAASSTSLPTLTTWSVSVWHYYNGTNTAGQPAIVTEIYPPSINYMLGAFSSSTNLQTGFFVPSTWYTTPSYSLTSNNWYYIVGTYDGSALKLYVNNTLINSATGAAEPISSNAGIRLMRGWDSNAYWGGNLATVGIYDKALSSGQITALWDSDKSRFGYSGATGGGYTLIITPYNPPAAGKTIFPNFGVGATAGILNPNTFATGGVYWNPIDVNSVDQTSYYNGMIGNAVTASFTQNGNTAIYSGSTGAFTFIPATGSQAASFAYNPNSPNPGTLTLTQASPVNFTLGETVYISYT
jgi:hypothetical protein